MTKNISIIALVLMVFLNSCKKTTNTHKTDITTTKKNEQIVDYVTTSSFSDKDGKKIELLFNKSNGTASFKFNGETIELVAQRTASGIWYKNEQYELKGKGENIELTKNRNIILKN